MIAWIKLNEYLLERYYHTLYVIFIRFLCLFINRQAAIYIVNPKNILLNNQ